MQGLKTHGWRRWTGAWLVALAIAVRLVSPSGWMLVAGGDGAPQLVICTGHGPAELSHRGEPPTHAPGQSQDHACVFAGPAAPPQPALIGVPVAESQPDLVAPPTLSLADQRPGRGLAAPPPPSQGPPANA